MSFSDRVREPRPGQTFIGIKLSHELADELEKAAGTDKSQWVRSAIRERLERFGIKVPAEKAAAPSRKGKGGPKPKKSGYRKTKAHPKEKKI